MPPSLAGILAVDPSKVKWLIKPRGFDLYQIGNSIVVEWAGRTGQSVCSGQRNCNARQRHVIGDRYLFVREVGRPSATIGDVR
jgi:hypothetical protein